VRSEEFAYLTALDLCRLIRTRQASPVEIVESALARLEVLQPVLNAFVTVTADLALDAARAAEAAVMSGQDGGLLAGLPLSIKDLTAVKGVRFTSGSRTLADFISPHDSPVSERVKAHGAAIVGKTTTTEFGCKASSNSPLTGATRNPWNLDKTTGGSSAGAGASVAAGITPFALGTDGGGSIRIPSSFCGLLGIKAQFGRVPVFPAAATPTLAHVGPMARTVRDAALLLTAISGFDARDPASVAAECRTFSPPASNRRNACGSPGARRWATPGRRRKWWRSPARPPASSRSWAARSSWSRRCSTIRGSCGWPSSTPASAPSSRSR
jgi:Asp-tRNA(Asn)/Glu-tRNA(Gln) amidotransferase A subunit family amidase